MTLLTKQEFDKCKCLVKEHQAKVAEMVFDSFTKNNIGLNPKAINIDNFPSEDECKDDPVISSSIVVMNTMLDK